MKRQRGVGAVRNTGREAHKNNRVVEGKPEPSG